MDKIVRHIFIYYYYFLMKTLVISVGMAVTPILDVFVIFGLVLIRNVQHVYTIVPCQNCWKRFVFFLRIYVFFYFKFLVMNSGHHSGHFPLCTCIRCEDGSCDSCTNFKHFIHSLPSQSGQTTMSTILSSSRRQN